MKWMSKKPDDCLILDSFCKRIFITNAIISTRGFVSGVLEAVRCFQLGGSDIKSYRFQNAAPKTVDFCAFISS